MKRGQNQIIVGILLVAISLVAFLIVYNVVKPLVSEKSGDISSKSDELKLMNALSVDFFSNYDEDKLDVKVSRDSTPGEMTGIGYTIGTTVTTCYVEQADILLPLETKTFSVNMQGCSGTVLSVSVQPIFGEVNPIQPEGLGDLGDYIFIEEFDSGLDGWNADGLCWEVANDSGSDDYVQYGVYEGCRESGLFRTIEVDYSKKYLVEVKYSNGANLGEESPYIRINENTHYLASYNLKTESFITSAPDDSIQLALSYGYSVNPQYGRFYRISIREINVVQPIGIPINNCTVIKNSGSYYLAKDLVGNQVTANCIDIRTSNVTFDCQAHSINGAKTVRTGSNDYYTIPGESILIYNRWQNDNTIKNCNLESGKFGITSYGDRNKILNNNFKSFSNYGIRSQGYNNLIEDNYLDNSGKAIAFEDGNNNIARNNFVKNSFWGLSSWRAQSNQYINNKVLGGSYGIVLYDASNTVIQCGEILNNDLDIYLYADNWYNPLDSNNNIRAIGLKYSTEQIGDGAEFNEIAGDCSGYCEWVGDKCIDEYISVTRTILQDPLTPLLYHIKLNIDINENLRPNAYIITETYPVGWKIIGADYDGIYNTSSRLNESKIEWLASEFTGLPIQDIEISYHLEKTNANNAFSGSWMTLNETGIIGG